MSNEFYDHGSFPATGSSLSSAAMRAELESIEAGFDKLPTMTGNANKVVVVNPSGTGLTSVASDAKSAETIHAATGKTTPVDADEIPLADSEASWGLKKLTWANLKAWVLTNISYTGTLTGGTGVVNLGSGQFVKDAAGNVGVGVAPAAWFTGSKALQVASLGLEGRVGTSYAGIYCNAYIDAAGANYRYVADGYATWYRHSNGTHSWHTAASGTAGGTVAFTQAMTLDTSGNLGLGVTPSAWSAVKAMQISNSLSLWGNPNGGGYINNNAYFDGSTRRYVFTQAASEYVQAGGAHIWSSAPSGTAGGAVTFTDRMTLDANGRFVLNSASSYGSWNSSLAANAYWTLQASGAAYGYIGQASATTGGANTDFGIRADGNLIFGAGGYGEDVRIDTSGNLLVGTTSAPLYSSKMRVEGPIETHTTQFNMNAGASGLSFEWVLRQGAAQIFYVNNATVLASLSTTGVWTNASDARYKENIRPVTYGLSTVMQLLPRAYNVIGSEKEEIGFIAQEVETVLPELVDSTTNSVTGEDRLTLSYGQMSAVLVKAIQEQQETIQSLQTQLDAQNTAMQALAARLEALEGNA